MAKFLVVDDSMIARKLVKKILLGGGHEIIAEAENGQKAIAAYKESKPDVVTMDIDMPVLGGIEATEEIIRFDPAARIILVTAHESHDLVDVAKNIGIKFYINKPVNDEKLLNMVNLILAGDTGLSSGGKAAFESELLKAGDEITINHYLSVKSILSHVTEVSRGRLTVKVSRDMAISSFLVNNPVVVGYAHENDAYLYGCSILAVNQLNNTLILEIRTFETISNRRELDSIPVSLFVEVKEKPGIYKKHDAIVWRFSAGYLDINSKIEYNIDDIIDLDLYILQKITPLRAKVVKKEKRSNNYEYEINILVNYDTQKLLKWNINVLKEEYEKAIKEISKH